METIQLGKSDLRVSRFGFGCWQLGGHGWQHNDQAAITAAIGEALEFGVNCFDTSDIYGFGQSEALLGDVLSKDARGKDAVVVTKFGVRMEDGKKWYDNSKMWMDLALAASLKRLKRDTIDLYLVHWHDEKRPFADIFSDLERLRESGKIRWYGLANSPFTSVPAPYPPGFVSFSAEYSLIRRRPADEETRLKAMRDVGFICWGGLAQGMLSGKYTSESSFDKSDIRSRNNHIFVDRYWPAYELVLALLQEAAIVHERSMAQTALRWILDSQPYSVALAGIKNSSQLKENLGALDWKLDSLWVEKLDQASLACRKQVEALG